MYSVMFALGLLLAVAISVIDGEKWLEDRDAEAGSQLSMGMWYIW